MGAIEDGAKDAPAFVVIDRAAGAVVAGPAAPLGGAALREEAR
jgi:hypothetical protein